MPAPSFSLSFPTSPSSNHPFFFSNTDRTELNPLNHLNILNHLKLHPGHKTKTLKTPCA